MDSIDKAREVNSFQMVELSCEQSQMTPQHWEGRKRLISPLKKARGPKIMIKCSLTEKSSPGKDALAQIMSIT